MPNRYAMRQAHPGMWTVYDVFTGRPAIVEDCIMVAMDIQDANEMVELLNLQDVTRRAKLETGGRRL